MLGYFQGCVGRRRSQSVREAVLLDKLASRPRKDRQRSRRDAGTFPRLRDSRALNGDGQSWLSVSLLCRGTSAVAWAQRGSGGENRGK